MSATITLPLSLRSRIAAIRRRARLLRAVRGLGLLVLVLALSGAAAVFADYWLDLPHSHSASPLLRVDRRGRRSAAVRRRRAAVPAHRRGGAGRCHRAEIPRPRRTPHQCRRTRRNVTREGHGSPVLIALLMDETEKHSTHLDFRPAVPARRAGVLAGPGGRCRAAGRGAGVRLAAASTPISRSVSSVPGTSRLRRLRTPSKSHPATRSPDADAPSRCRPI